jgi:hypothetical protein
MYQEVDLLVFEPHTHWKLTAYNIRKNPGKQKTFKSHDLKASILAANEVVQNSNQFDDGVMGLARIDS